MKQLNARIQKWRQMLKNDLHSDPSLLKKRVRKGIPCCIRSLVWPRLINIENYKKKQKVNYKQLIKQDTIYGEEICKDIPRTFPTENPRCVHKSLFNVLKAISLCFPELGYCQGMNFVTMRMLEIMDDETAFWIVHYLLTTYQKIYWNYRCPEAMEVQNVIISELIRKHLHSIWECLNEQGITPLLYTPSWLITLFSSPLPAEMFYRFFQCFLVEGQKIIYRAALAMLKLKQKIIQSGNGIIHIVDNNIYEGYQPDQFINTMFSFKLQRSQIERIEKTYTQINKQNIVAMRYSANQVSKKRMQNTQKFKYPETSMLDYEIDLSIFKKLSFKLLQLQ